MSHSLPLSLYIIFWDKNMLFFWPLPIWFLHPSRSLSHHLFVPFSLSLSVISFFYFDKFCSLSLLLYPGNFFAFKSSSLPRYLYLSLSHYLLLLRSLCHYIFLYSLSLCLCLSNYLWFFGSLSVCSAVLLLSVTPLALSV